MDGIPLFRVYNSAQMELDAIEVLRSGSIASGRFSESFANEFGALVCQRNIVTTNDMSNAILIALRLAGVGAGDEVLTTAFACMSTNSPIAMMGAKPIWVDVDPVTATIDMESLRKATTPHCKCLILYHVCGYPGPLEEVKSFCENQGIVLIEDCDNALLAQYRGKNVGEWGRFGVYSFYPTRQINASEGGALACAMEEDAIRATKLRRYGIDSRRFRNEDGEIDPNCDIPEIGWPALMNNLCSALGLSQISSVTDRLKITRANALEYDKAFKNSRVIQSIQPLPDANPSYWTYMLRTKHAHNLLRYLKNNGVGCSQVHLLNNRYSGFGQREPDLSGSKELMNSVVSIPCGWWVEEQDRRWIIDKISKFCF